MFTDKRPTLKGLTSCYTIYPAIVSGLFVWEQFSASGRGRFVGPSENLEMIPHKVNFEGGHCHLGWIVINQANFHICRLQAGSTRLHWSHSM